AIRDRTGKTICRKSTCTAAKHVAGKLIKHDHERQRGLGPRFPGRQLTRCSRIMESKKARFDLSVERIVLAEPFCGSGIPPEGKHGVRGLIHGAHSQGV